MQPAVVVIVIFAAASFFFALAETALFSLSKWQVDQLVERYPRRGRRVARLLQRPVDLLATLALGNTFANAAMLAVVFILVIQARWALAPAVLALAAFTILVCEVFPKTLAVRRPGRWALRVAWLLFLFEQASQPFYRVAQRLNAVLLRTAATPSASTATLTDAEYHELIEMASSQGALAEAEKEIILQIIRLDQRTAREVMRPRAGLAVVSDDATVPEMLAAARKFRHRRLPIYDETPDTIVGILNTRALLLDPGIDLAEAIELPSFVPESMNLLQLFRALQKQQRGLAIVLDEFGGTAGIVTMEDILGELIGRLRPPAASEGLRMEKIAEDRWRLNGSLRLDDFRREYPALPEIEAVETMGGLLTHLRGVVPEAGESAVIAGLQLTALAADGRRVRELLVQRQK